MRPGVAADDDVAHLLKGIMAGSKDKYTSVPIHDGRFWGFVSAMCEADEDSEFRLLDTAPLRAETYSLTRKCFARLLQYGYKTAYPYIEHHTTVDPVNFTFLAAHVAIAVLRGSQDAEGLLRAPLYARRLEVADTPSETDEEEDDVT